MENIKYEEAIKRLEEIVQLLENNEVSLDESIDLFQEGMALTKICENKLKDVETKVAQIMQKDGQLVEAKDEDNE